MQSHSKYDENSSQTEIFDSPLTKNIYIEQKQSDLSLFFANFLIPTKNNQILIRDLFKRLKKESEYNLSSGFSVSLWSDLESKYLPVGQDPFDTKPTFPVKNFRNCDQLTFQIEETNSPLKRRKRRNMSTDKRVKERGIIQVQALIAEWRNIYEKHQGRLNLDQVAAVVKVSRKTLDDYSLQLRRAKDLGFDFAKYKDKKMGYLRNFVKKNKRLLNNKEKALQQQQKKLQQQQLLEQQKLLQQQQLKLQQQQQQEEQKKLEEQHQKMLEEQLQEQQRQQNIIDQSLLLQSYQQQQLLQLTISQQFQQLASQFPQVKKEVSVRTKRMSDTDSSDDDFAHGQSSSSSSKNAFEVDDFFNFGKDETQDMEFMQYYF